MGSTYHERAMERQRINNIPLAKVSKGNIQIPQGSSNPDFHKRYTTAAQNSFAMVVSSAVKGAEREHSFSLKSTSKYIPQKERHLVADDIKEYIGEWVINKFKANNCSLNATGFSGQTLLDQLKKACELAGYKDKVRANVRFTSALALLSSKYLNIADNFTIDVQLGVVDASQAPKKYRELRVEFKEELKVLVDAMKERKSQLLQEVS